MRATPLRLTWALCWILTHPAREQNLVRRPGDFLPAISFVVATGTVALGLSVDRMYDRIASVMFDVN